MKTTSYIELSRTAYRRNLKVIRNHFSAVPLITFVVKGNAYGHGLEEFTKMAQQEGVNHFSVFSSNEAAIVKGITGNKATILILGDCDNSNLEWAISQDIEVYIFSIDRLKSAIRFAQKLKKQAHIHLELETGMNRTGLEKCYWQKAADLLKNNADYVEFKGLCTHLAGAEDIANHERIKKQTDKFKAGHQFFINTGLKPRLVHTCCSAAAIRYPEMHGDMLRLGILQYGFWPSKEIRIEYLHGNVDQADPLKRIITWKSRIMSIKDVPQHEYIGYGNTYQAFTDMRIGLVPVGYAYGYNRSLSNLGRVLVGGERTVVVGMVNMNCIAVNLNTAPDAKIDDEVVMIGHQGNHEITVAAFTDAAAQINYETLTRIPLNIPRKIAE